MPHLPDFDAKVADLAAALPLRAAGVIVTLYGDVVVPRGGEVWIGTIIETCASLGISETLVRTAVSRLVAAGQLEGWRRGRRSYYRLTDQAGAEFESAARIIYGPPEPWAWRFVVLPEEGGDALMMQLERLGFARLRPLLAVGPARLALPRGVLGFEADPSGAIGLLPQFAASAWDLAPHAQAYREFLTRFAPLERAAPRAKGAAALAARLMLVHAWRGVLLRDPRLPPEALPRDWPGHAARGLFQRLYAALSPAADSHIGAAFEAAHGRLPATNADTEARLSMLQQGENVEAAQ
ncbi:MAG: phenylacetic acid degradation operon negative regulatory protein PaaX [Pararhodobacter sp.]